MEEKCNLTKEEEAVWKRHTKECVIAINEFGIITEFNRQAKLAIENLHTGKDVYYYFSKKDLAAVKKKEFRYIRNGEHYYEVNGYKGDKKQILILSDRTREFQMSEEMESIYELNCELRQLFEQYADDMIYVTDGEGNTLWFGQYCLDNCGVTAEYLYHKNVRELQAEGIFSPSVIMKVLESSKMEVVAQKTALGKQLVSVGIPVKNDAGKIKKVVALTRDLSQQFKLGKLLPSMNVKKWEEENKETLAYPNLITCSECFHNVVEMVKLVSTVDSTVLLFGETGTGKEVLAKMIHQLSKRKDQSFIKVNCGAIAANLVESELFGYESGAFTGAKKDGKVGLVEAANHGTLFLDEISELPIDQQVKLLQVLQERSMTRVGGTKTISLDIRFIAATNRNLAELVEQNKFRQDLYYRLNVVPIVIPPLRERKEDIPLLIRHFLSSINEKYGMKKEFSNEIVSMMLLYSWPGNVRELEHLVERLVVTTKKMVVTRETMPVYVIQEIEDAERREKALENAFKKEREVSISNNVVCQAEESKFRPLVSAVEAFERDYIKRALEKYKTGVRVAEVLEVNQSTLSRKIKKYGL